MEAVVAVAMTGGTIMEEVGEDMEGTTMVRTIVEVKWERCVCSCRATWFDNDDSQVDTMIMRTGSSSKATMEEEEEEEFGMILHSIKAEEVAAAAGRLQ